VPAVKESWGLSGNETPEELSEIAYGAKFIFSPVTWPGYVGDLYILSGDALGEPFTLIRKDNRLVVVQEHTTPTWQLWKPLAGKRNRSSSSDHLQSPGRCASHSFSRRLRPRIR
jgi:hypothetical protein